MKAMVCERFGGPEVLAERVLPDPAAPGPGEIQVRIEARGVQYVDVLMLAGKYQFRPEFRAQCLHPGRIPHIRNHRPPDHGGMPFP